MSDPGLRHPTVYEYNGSVIGIDVTLRGNSPIGSVLSDTEMAQVAQALHMLSDAFAINHISLTHVTLEVKT